MIKKLSIVLFAMMWLFLANALFAKGPAGERNIYFNKPGQAKQVQALSNISNWAYWVRHDGWSGRDPITSGSGGTYPRGTAHVIFQDGLIWGAILSSDVQLRSSDPDPTQRLRVGGQTYRIGTTPGWIETAGDDTNDPVAIDAEDSRVSLYRIRRDWETLAVGQATVINDVAEMNGIDIGSVTEQMQQDLINQYQHDWENWPVDVGAPYYDVNGNGQYDPGYSEDLNGDGEISVGEIEEPGIAGADQVIWFAINDLDPGSTTNLYGSQPLGLEVQITVWAYNQPGTTLGQIIFKRYRIINKSGYRLDSMFVAQWSDPDVGVYTDDLVGSDPARSLGFAYSGNLTDGDFAAFNLPPASVGYDFFQGPIVYSPGDTAIFNLEKRPDYKNLPMISFGYFAAGSQIDDPELGTYNGTLEWYNLLNGYIPSPDTANPAPFVHGFGPNAGQPTFFPVDGDPVNVTGDVDGFGTNLPPGDRRMSLSTGPFTMQPGDTQEVVVAVVGGIVDQPGGNNRNAIAQLKANDNLAQFVYDNLFKAIPKPPAAPKVNVTVMEDQIILEWGGDHAAVAETEKDLPLGYKFEGYNIYQLPNASATKAQAKRLATFDRADNAILKTTGLRFVPEFGDLLRVPIQFGNNTGLQRFFIIDKDFINDKPLFAGNPYYFAVTAYNAKDADGDGVADTDVDDQSLESSMNVIEIIPQPPVPGTRYPHAPGSQISVVKNAASTGNVSVTVLNPKAVTGHDYKVEFNADPHWILEPDSTDSLGNVVTWDTLGSWHTWNLVDQNTGERLVSDNDNLSGDYNYPIVDGLLVQVEGPKSLGLAGWSYEGDRWVSGVNWGGQEFFGGLDIGANFFGSTLGLGDLVPVHIEFQDKESVESEGFWSKGAVYRRDLGYAYNGTGELPMRAFDVVDPDNPRRINICFVEMDGQDGAPANNIWDMGWDGSQFPGELGAREYLFFMKSDYNEGADYDDNNWGPAADVLYGIWPKNRGSREYLRAKFTMDIYANIPNGPNDTYTFSTQAVITGDLEAAKEDVEKINVFPNPYYANNPQETSRFQRFVTFTHLPQKATIRIFSLSGVQVRKLEKDDPSQFLQWDLRNEASLPVASGIYIAHVDLPDLGKTKVLKLFIIQAAEILEFF